MYLCTLICCLGCDLYLTCVNVHCRVCLLLGWFVVLDSGYCLVHLWCFIWCLFGLFACWWLCGLGCLCCLVILLVMIAVVICWVVCYFLLLIVRLLLF